MKRGSEGRREEGSREKGGRGDNEGEGEIEERRRGAN